MEGTLASSATGLSDQAKGLVLALSISIFIGRSVAGQTGWLFPDGYGQFLAWPFFVKVCRLVCGWVGEVVLNSAF